MEGTPSPFASQPAPSSCVSDLPNVPCKSKITPFLSTNHSLTKFLALTPDVLRNGLKISLFQAPCKLLNALFEANFHLFIIKLCTLTKFYIVILVMISVWLHVSGQFKSQVVNKDVRKDQLILWYQKVCKFSFAHHTYKVIMLSLKKIWTETFNITPV